jgi:hypothetical protein
LNDFEDFFQIRSSLDDALKQAIAFTSGHRIRFAIVFPQNLKQNDVKSVFQPNLGFFSMEVEGI